MALVVKGGNGMKRRLVLLGIGGLVAAAVGAGLAGSLGHEEPARLPNLAADEIYVAGPDGDALKCRGKLVKVKRSSLGGRVPPLAPTQALRRGLTEQPPVRVARCARDADGDETGGVVFVDEQR